MSLFIIRIMAKFIGKVCSSSEDKRVMTSPEFVATSKSRQLIIRFRSVTQYLQAVYIGAPGAFAAIQPVGSEALADALVE